MQAPAAGRGGDLGHVHDQLSSGQKFRMLTVVDVFNREALASEVGQRLRGDHVVAVLDRLVRQRAEPKYVLSTMAKILRAVGRHADVSPSCADRLKPRDNIYLETSTDRLGISVSMSNGSLRRPRRSS